MFKTVLLATLLAAFAEFASAHAEDSAPKAAMQITCKAPGTVFLDTEKLDFTLPSAPVEQLRYEVKDFYDHKVSEGIWPDSGSLRLAPLPCGYYVITLTDENVKSKGSRSFTVVGDPAGRKLNPDTPFAMDTALSWLCNASKPKVGINGNAFDLIVEIIRRGGISSIRERLLWNGVQAGPQAPFNWGDYMANANKLNAAGVKVLGMTHDAPAWARYDAENKRTAPDDLIALYRFTKQLSVDFKGRMPSWEFWNEADHGAHPESAWAMAAAQKAAYLGYKAGNPDLTVLHGSFCQFPLNQYAAAFIANDTTDYFDVFNYHVYRGIGSYPEIISNLRSSMRQYGIGDMPIYITEAGTNAEGDSKGSSPLPRIAETTPEQDRMVCEFIVKSPILFLSQGVAKTYFFVLPPYNERNGTKAWGILRWDYSAKPQFTAYATLLRELGNAEYQGEYDLGSGKRGFLFRQPDGQQTLACWLESEIDRDKRAVAIDDKPVPEQSISLPSSGSVRLVDVVGTTRNVPCNAIPISRYPEYITLSQPVQPTKLPAPFGSIQQRKSGKDLTVVVKPVFLDGFETSSDRTSVILKNPTGKLRLEYFNLSGKEKSGKPVVAGCKVAGLPDTLVIPPMEKRELLLDLSSPSDKFTIEAGGEFNGKEISKCRVPVFSAEVLRLAPTTKLDTANPERWRKNAAGNMDIAFDSQENAMWYRTVFNTGDHWTYPEYILKLPKESLEDAAAIRFEWKANAICSGQANLMLVEGVEKENGKTHTIRAIPPDSDWRTQTILLPANLKGIRMIRLGANPKQDDFAFWVKNLEIVKSVKP